MKAIHLVADDFGLSAGVDRGILTLIEAGRLSGTGCMTVFAEWQQSAAALRAASAARFAGLHLTLTDQPALTGHSPLAPHGRLPSLAGLMAALGLRRLADAAIFAELDAQLDAFANHLGVMPAYFDGHQHVHFLPPARRWLARRKAEGRIGAAWLRGAPARPAVPAMTGKVAITRALARGFDTRMRRAGYDVRGPLDGFYDWRKPETFAVACERFVAAALHGAVVMVHPGEPDETLKARDGLVAARGVELAHLRSQVFAECLAQNGARIAAIEND